MSKIFGDSKLNMNEIFLAFQELARRECEIADMGLSSWIQN
jgi:hypothetical protein